MASLPPGPVFDAHHHLWRRAEVPRQGILAAPYLDRDFSWDDLDRAAGGLELSGTCLVQAREDPAEVSFVEEVAAQHPRLRAMVAFAPVERPELGAVLDDLRRRPIVRGVRRSTQHEADPDFVARPEFVAGARQVGAKGLLLEVCVRHQQLPAVTGLAAACPETSIVVEHLGKPDVTGAPPTGWLRTMERFARLPNTWCKVSPVVHADADPAFSLQRQAPFIRHAVDCFGWDRSLFGSNWPVATAVVAYPEWAAIVMESLEDASPQQLDALFGANAARLYCGEEGS
ncbi:MAG: amidohydrolase family protein [Candidatus Dormibacteraceae bacterium]